MQPKVIKVPPKANDAYAPVATAPAPIDTSSTTTAVPSGPRGVQLASGPSLESVKLSWSVLSQTHGQVLKPLEPRIVPTSDGSAFRLLAGPFNSEADAQKACTALKARGVNCRSSEYGGAPL